MNSIEITKKIYNLLSNDETLSGLVGSNIFPLIAESNTEFPFIVFKRNSITPEYTKDWITSETIQVEVVCASDKYFETIDCAVAVRNKLEGYRDADIREVTVNYITEDFLNDCYTQRITFNIII